MIVYELKINFKSGKSEIIRCTDFALYQHRMTYTQYLPETRAYNKALYMNFDEIESVFQIGHYHVQDQDQQPAS